MATLFAFSEHRLIALACSPEVLAAIGECDVIASRFADGEGGFNGGIASADDEDVLALVILGLDQAVSHFVEFLAGNVEMARHPSFAESENDIAGAIDASRSFRRQSRLRSGFA